jgi:hypothetical protein
MQRPLSYSTFLLLSSYILFGCGIEEDKKKSPATTPTSAFLTASDFERRYAAPETKADEIKKELEGMSMTMLNDGDNYEGEDDKCMQKLQGMKWNATKNKAFGSLSGNFAGCLTNQEYVEVTRMNVKFYIELTCEDGDLSKLNGKTVNMDASIIAETDCRQLSRLMNAENASSLILTYQGITGRFDVTVFEFEGNKDFGPCTRTITADKVTVPTNCVHYSRVIKFNNSTTRNGKTTKEADEEDITQLSVTKTLTHMNDTKTKWYDSGEIAFEFNDWNGKIIYSGGTTKPTYSARKDDESTSGTLSASSSLKP